jgi:predicted amidohydrolase YtcJ
MKRAFAALFLAASSSPVFADTLIDNVKGITLTEAGQVQRFTGLVFNDEGKIVRLVTGKEPDWVESKGKKKKKDRWTAPADRPQYRIDGGGRVMLPGMIDAHGHVIQLGLNALSLDLSDTKSLDEAKAKIAAYVTANPNRRWIIGRGWNQEQWGLGRFPTAADLEGITDKPIWLERVDGHAGWANAAAMKIANVTPTTPSPNGGRIEKTAGQPNGIFVDAAMDLINKAAPAITAKDRDLALQAAQGIMLKYGLTAMADMGTSIDDWLAFRRAGDRGALQVRIFSYAAGIEPMAMVGAGEPTPWLYQDRLRMAGVKLYADGALGSRGAWLKAHYHDKAGERGLAFLDDTKLRNLISRVAMDNFQVAVHAIGDAANDQVLSAIEDVAVSYKGDRRWRIEHAQVVDPKDIKRFAQNGIIASMQPVHQTSDRLMAETRLGPARLEGAYAWQTILTAGGTLAFGSDTPVENANPFPGLAVAISRQDEKGQPEGGWRAQDRVSREVALGGFTRSAAYASFAESKIGRLAPGLRADFILVDQDPITAAPADIRRTTVYETWINGRRVYRRQID